MINSYARHASVVPNDPRFAEQWSLNNTGVGGGIAGSDIKAPSGWDTRTSANTVVVAVIDSGLLTTHQDAAANLWVNPAEIPGNGVDDDGNGYIDDINGINSILARGSFGSGTPTDNNGHGSHVAGIIGAVGNNATGITGVAWNVRLMPLKFLGANGSGRISDAIECIDYAIAKGAHVINASYGATDPQNFSQAELDAVRRARDSGIVAVAAAGNDGLDLDISRAFPASYPVEKIVAVGNSTRLDDPSASSNFGPGAVELFAPGTDILSLGIATNASYATLSGTSMSAPHVAGAIALLKAQFPGDSYRGLINRLLRGVQVRQAFTGRTQTGGRLDLAGSLASATNRPFNDDFAKRAILMGANFSVRSANLLGTREPGEPVHAGAPGGASLWWSWTPAASAAVTFDTSGSEIDTLLAVYTGLSPDTLEAVASNDNSTGTASRVNLTVSAGTTYHIAIDAKGVLTGAITFSLVDPDWQFPTGSAVTGSPAVAPDGTVYVKSDDGFLYAISPGGAQLWRFPGRSMPPLRSRAPRPPIPGCIKSWSPVRPAVSPVRPHR